MKEKESVFKKFKTRKVLYGITDRSTDPWWQKLNDFLIDHSRVTNKEKSIFFNSLQLLVNSGVRFTRALEILGERQRNERFRRVLQSIHYDMIQSGTSFSSAMDKYPSIFPLSESKMIHSGEIAGKIEETLEAVSKQIQKNIELQIRLRSALMYPITVLGAIIVAGIIVMLFVVPKFMVLFSSFPSAQLPLATKLLIEFSDFLSQYWWFLITALFAGWFLFRNWKESLSGKKSWDNFVLHIPLFKTLINNIQTVRIASNFSTLLLSGIPIVKALQILSEIIPNVIISEGILKVKQDIIEGKKIHESFAENQNFEMILSEVIEIGEQSGRIPEILQKTATQYEIEIDAQLKNLTTLIEPLTIVLVGGAVVFMAVAIMTPIFKLQELFTAG